MMYEIVNKIKLIKPFFAIDKSSMKYTLSLPAELSITQERLSNSTEIKEAIMFLFDELCVYYDLLDADEIYNIVMDNFGIFGCDEDGIFALSLRKFIKEKL